MRNFQKLYNDIEVSPLLNKLMQSPELWNEQTFRTQSPNSTMHEVDDIILRFSDVTNLNSDNAELYDVFQNGVNPEWTKNILVLSPVKDIIRTVMNRMNAYEVGRCLISRIKPGACIKPHSDTIGAYVNQPDLMRVHITLKGCPGSITYCGDEEVCMRDGEAWWYNTRLVHKVTNNSADDRITLLLDLKVFP